MTDFITRIRQRKLVQWALAYVAFAFALLQGIEAVAQPFGWPQSVQRLATLALVVGFFLVLLLAWYHGEQGRQRVSGTELLIIALLLGLGGAFLWYAGRPARRHEPLASATTPQPHAASTGASRATSAPVPAPAAAASSIPAKSIAVLPFENLSTDKANAYFADGMQDLILTKLADIGDLKVISRTSTMRYASRPADLTTVGRQLGVATVLEGSVQKAGDQVLINVQLIDARTDSHIWAQSYQRTLHNIFGVEGEVADTIANALKARLTPRESAVVSRVPTRNLQAYDAYLRGNYFIGRAFAGQFSSVPDAVKAYRQAVHHDPKFALAWARLAYSQSFLGYFGFENSVATRKQALANARHALALEPNLPQAHFALGYVYRLDYADYGKALREFEIARRGLPNNAKVLAAIAYVQVMQGRFRAALEKLRRANVLDPRDPNLAMSLAHGLVFLGRYDAGRKAFQRMLAIAPDDPEGYAGLSDLALLQYGDTKTAMRWLDKAPADIQSDSVMIQQRAYVLLIERKFAQARKTIARLKAGSRFIGPIDVLRQKAMIDWPAGDRSRARILFRQVAGLAQAALSAPPAETAMSEFRDLAIAQAAMGHRNAAMRTLDRMRVFMVKKMGPKHVSYDKYVTARVGVLLQENGVAVGALRELLASSTGGWLSVPLLKIDPFWDPLRKDPRFQKLLKDYTSAGLPPQAPATPRSSAGS